MAYFSLQSDHTGPFLFQQTLVFLTRRLVEGISKIDFSP
jgi:hypothetical protein